MRKGLTILLGAVALSTLTLVGCLPKGHYPVAMTSNDFDGDGDKDFIVGRGDGRLYFFENDGKGYFTSREFTK